VKHKNTYAGCPTHRLFSFAQRKSGVGVTTAHTTKNQNLIPDPCSLVFRQYLAPANAPQTRANPAETHRAKLQAIKTQKRTMV
jgi:hypothetical protein